MMPQHCPSPSPRHLEVLRLVAEDHTNEQIATHLGVSLQTVKNHLREVCLRLGVHGRAGAVGRAYQLGILLPRTDPAADAVRAHREQAARLEGLRLAASSVQPHLSATACYGELLLASPELSPGLRVYVHKLLAGARDALGRLHHLTPVEAVAEQAQAVGVPIPGLGRSAAPAHPAGHRSGPDGSMPDTPAPAQGRHSSQ